MLGLLSIKSASHVVGSSSSRRELMRMVAMAPIIRNRADQNIQAADDVIFLKASIERRGGVQLRVVRYSSVVRVLSQIHDARRYDS